MWRGYVHNKIEEMGKGRRKTKGKKARAWLTSLMSALGEVAAATTEGIEREPRRVWGLRRA